MQQTSITLAQVAAACDQHGIPPSKFGREAIGDPRLIGDLRNGRVLRPATLERVWQYIAALGVAASPLPSVARPPREVALLAPEARPYEHAAMMRKGSAKLLAALLAAKGEC